VSVEVLGQLTVQLYSRSSSAHDLNRSAELHILASIPIVIILAYYPVILVLLEVLLFYNFLINKIIIITRDLWQSPA